MNNSIQYIPTYHIYVTYSTTIQISTSKYTKIYSEHTYSKCKNIRNEHNYSRCNTTQTTIISDHTYSRIK